MPLYSQSIATAKQPIHVASAAYDTRMHEHFVLLYHVFFVFFISFVYDYLRITTVWLLATTNTKTGVRGNSEVSRDDMRQICRR